MHTVPQLRPDRAQVHCELALQAIYHRLRLVILSIHTLLRHYMALLLRHTVVKRRSEVLERLAQIRKHPPITCIKLRKSGNI